MFAYNDALVFFLLSIVSSFPNTENARTSSVQTFDSLDFARYSDDGERQVDERVAVLEFELRKAQETIKSLRASLTQQAETELSTPENQYKGGLGAENSEAVTPLEKKALNFLVNEYLLQANYKVTSVTFAEENEEQVNVILWPTIYFSFQFHV
uniref:LisH domain-containing protein n=1 Tax=Biomphalaria glabrata TaxID=6526 RepID=A0A2C9M1S2_BIOGL